jgi:cell division protein FtsL
MKKPILVLIILFLTIGVLVVARSMASARITTSGLELSQVQDETHKLKTENAILREKIFSLSSLTHVSERAEKVGFVESKQVFAVSSSKPIARGE